MIKNTTDKMNQVITRFDEAVRLYNTIHAIEFRLHEETDKQLQGIMMIACKVMYKQAIKILELGIQEYKGVT